MKTKYVAPDFEIVKFDFENMLINDSIEDVPDIDLDL